MDFIANDKLKKLHDILVSRGIDNKSFEEFESNFSNNEEKQRKLHDILVSRGIDNKSFEEFKSNFFIKKKDDSVVPTSQEDVTVSTTKDETTPTSLESSDVRVDPLTGLEYSPSQIQAIRGSFNQDIDLEDKNIKAAIDSGTITDNDLIIAGYKTPEKISTLKRQPTPQEREDAKRKIGAFKSKTKEEIDFFVSQKKLDTPYIYEQYSSPEARDIESLSYSKPEDYTGFVEKYFDKEKLENANINIKDFDGFLEFKGLKKGFLKKSENFKSTYGSKYDPKLAMELELSRMIDLYVREQLNRDIEQQKLQYQKEEGVDPDFTKDKYSFNISESNVNIDKITQYYEENMPIMTKQLKEVDEKNQKLYQRYLDGDIGAGYFLSELGDQAYEGFETRVQELSATASDILGFSRTADGVRLQMDQEELREVDNLSYSYVEGKKVNLDGKDYLVDNSGNIYDLDLKKRVTNFLDKKTREEILEKPGTQDFSFSATGTAYESANVVGDMAVQIGLQGASGALLKGSSALMSAKRAKDIAKYIPIKRGMASSILAQSTLGASSGYENTLKLAREAGIEENEARKLAREASIQMARLYALTAPISPQTKATQAIFGDIKKNTLKEAIKSYRNIGREGFLEVLEKAGRKATTYFEEGLKEFGQENIQQAGETLLVNKNINELAQTKLSEDVITSESFINTSILSFTAGMLMPGAGGAINSSKRKVRKLLGMDGVDRIEALSTLSKNKDKVKQFLEVQKDKGIYTQEEVDELISEINIYEENISKIPDNLSSKTSLEIIADINKISQLENKKKTLDPSFHEDIDKEISEIRESIKQKTKEDAIQEQETRDIPDAERAEGVQEMEEEVREPAVEETEEVTEQLSPEEKAETVSELINRPVTLTKLGGFDLDTPLEGDMYVDGQRIVVEDDNGNITDIGNVDKISDKTLDEMGIEQQMPSVTTTDDGNIEFEGKIYNPESARIRRDSRGNITSVTLDQVGKPRSKTLRGKNAEDAAYNVLLRQAQQSTEIEQLLEQDEEFQNELRQAEEAAQGKTDQDTEQATTEESIASPEVTIEDAPDGTFLNIEMVEGKDGREMTQKEILDALPVEPLNVEVSGKTLVIQVPRKLSGSEMMKLAKDTEQDAIPQVSGKKGVLHAQSKEKMDLYEGKFIPNLFVKPKKIIKDEKPKAGNRLFNKPLKAVKAIADKYYKRIFKGERPRFEGVKKIDKEFAKRISDAFEAMQENPNDPEVKAAYEALAKETMDQYQDFKDAGYTIEVNNSEPYKNAQEMIDDLRDNKRMKIFSTESGFGDTPITEKQRKDNPLLRDSGVKDVNGETLLVNDIFRAVHDFYGHAELGNGFGPVGEENAWNVHARMFSPLARRAMTTETRGQNSYVNFSGVNDEAFKLRDQARKLRKEGKEAEAEALVAKVYEIMKFADQKIGLLPEEFSSLEQDGVSKLREMFKSTSKRKQVDNALNALSKIAPDVEVILHESEQAYAEATGETGRKQKTAGTYDETIVDGKVKKVIHINPDKANARTVAHEAFHAIFLNIVKSDAEAQRLAAAMIKAVYKSAPAELKKLIDNFAESKNADGSNNYDSAVQNEEKLAELIGYLATEYDSLQKPTKNVIKRFLDRLAKMFGMKPFTDNEVIDVLNTIASKVARGEAVTQEDLSSIQSNAKYVSQDEAKLWGTVPERKQVRTKPDPKKTVKAYKMFRVNKSKPGKLFPLFVNANDEVLMNTWLDAEVGELTKDGKVKSKIGNLAYRPGWHMGDLPIATHIGDKYNFEKGEVDKSLKKPTARSANHVWAEVEVAADVNWQEEANKRAKKTKAGKIIPRTAHITDRLPSDGYYRYKTNPNMTGEWLIGGSIKVTKVLTDDEVKAINDEAGVADLPRVKELDLKSIGFDRDTDVDLKVTPAPTDSKGNLKTPSKKSQNNLKKRKQNIIDGVKDQVVSGEIVSTSLPNKDDVHSSKEYVVGISSLEEMASTDNRAKDQYIKISKEAASYGISKTKNVNNFEDAKQVISEFKEVVKSNLKWLYDSVDKDVRDISKLWYDGANKISNDLANQYRYTTEQVAGVMAVLSPQMDWFRNLSLGERVIDIYKNNQDSLFDEKMIEFVNTKTTGTGKNKKPLFKNKEEIISRVKNKKLSELSSKDQSYFIRVYDEVYNSRNYNNITPNGEINGLVRTKNGNPGKVGWGDFSTIEKAISILNDGSVKNISTNLGNQHKVRNFFNNISNPNDKNAVTIDTHAVAAALLKPLSGKSKQVAYNFGGSSSVSTGMTGTYPVYADAYRELANELGILPREVQSITWEAGRGLFKAAFKADKKNGAKIDEIWNSYASGSINLEEARTKIDRLAGGISKPVWYEYLADNNIESLDQNSAALDQSNLDEEPTTRSRKQAPGRPSIGEIVRRGKQNNISDAAIRQFAKEEGYSIPSVNRAIEAYNEERRIEGQRGEKMFTGKNVVFKFLDKARRHLLSSKGFMPKSMHIGKEVMDGAIEANLKQAKQTLKDMQRFLKKFKGDEDTLIQNLNKYMRGDETIDVLPERLQPIAFAMRTHIDSLSKQLIESGAVSDIKFDDLKPKQKEELIQRYGTEEEARNNYRSLQENILENIGTYMTRSYEVFDNKDYKPTDEVILAAENKLREIYLDKATEIAEKENNTVSEVLDRLVTKKIQDILTPEGASEFLAGSKLGSKKTSILKERLDIPSEIRALMGEYTDPELNYARSIQKMSALVANQKFLNKMKEAGEGVFFFTEEDLDNNPKLKKEFNTRIAAETSQTMNPLSGMYTTKDIAMAMTNSPLISTKNPILNGAYNLWLKSVGAVKYSKTILSPATHAKNIIGNLAFMAYNGYISPKDYADAFKVVMTDLRNLPKEEQRAKLQEYIKAGIINQSATLGEIRAMFESKDSVEDMLIKRMNDPKQSLVTKAKTGLKKFGKAAEAAYQAEDDFFKIVAYENEKKRYAKAFFNKDFNDLTASEAKEVTDYVSEIVKNILPNYSRIGELGKIMKAVPVAGTFISFQIEAMRTAYNTVDLAFTELKDPKTRSIGAKRLMGIMAVVGLKAALFGSFGLFGDDEEDELVSKARNLLPPWAKNSNIIITESGKGKFKYINVSASDPHGFIDKALVSYMRGDSFGDSISSMTYELVGPFFQKDILLNTMFNILENNDDYGREIWNETDSTNETTQKIVSRLWKAIEPGGVTSVKKVIGSETPNNEIIGQLTGFKEWEIDVEKQSMYKSMNIKERSNQAAKDYGKAFFEFKDGKIKQKELDKRYEEANRRYKKIISEAIEIYETGLIFGVSPEVLNKRMSGTGRLGKAEIESISRGIVPDKSRAREGVSGYDKILKKISRKKGFYELK